MTEFRTLESLEEWRSCVRLQEATWGEAFSDIVPASILQVSRKIGGFAGGAFEGGRMIGFVYSLLGRFEDVPSHWSHMLAVDRGARGRGLGRELKLFQREAVLSQGIGTVFWSYDPMVARNAHLNLNRLGATVVRYVPNMYGADTGSPLHAGGETDRFIVRWDLDGPEARRALDGDSSRSARRLTAPLPDPAHAVLRPGSGRGAEAGLPRGDEVFVEIPADVESIPLRGSLERWRQTVRDAVLAYLRRGYAVDRLVRNPSADRCFYVLRRDG